MNRRRSLLSLAVAVSVLAAPAPASAAQQTYTGRLEIRHTDDFGDRKSATRYFLVQRGRRRPIVPTRAPRIPAGARVVVLGKRAGRAIRGTVHRLGARSAAYSPGLGPRKTAVLLVRSESDRPEPWTPAQFRARIFTDPSSANAFYREQSYGQVSLTGRDDPDGDVYGWLSFSSAGTECDAREIAAAARRAAYAAEIDLDGYDHIIIAFPRRPCAFGGMG